METNALTFGFCPLRLRVSGHGLSIEPLDNFDSVVDKIQRSGAVRMDWYYGSLFSSPD